MCHSCQYFSFQAIKNGASLFEYPHYTTNVFKGISLGGKGFFMRHGTLDGAPIGQKLSRGKKKSGNNQRLEKLTIEWQYLLPLLITAV